MTKLTKKEERIVKAFGDKWDLFTEEYKDHLLTRKHWVDMSVKYGALVGDNYYKSPTLQRLGFTDEEIEVNCEFWRPIALKGLEDNNGWISIEDQLPPTCESILCFSTKGGINLHYFSLMYADAEIEEWKERTSITHWQKEPNPPVY